MYEKQMIPIGLNKHAAQDGSPKKPHQFIDMTGCSLNSPSQAIEKQ